MVEHERDADVAVFSTDVDTEWLRADNAVNLTDWQ
jgi:hypothetical protein